MRFEAAGDFNSRTFPRVLYLDLWARLDPRVLDEVEFMRRCPNIQTLKWPGHYATDKFIQLLLDETWPGLDFMDAAIADVPDEIQATIILRLTKISTWRVRSFGPESFQALRYHFAGLEWLDFSMCTLDGPAGAMLQEILSSCPLLEFVAWPQVKASDLVPGKSWACTALRVFRVPVVFESGEIEDLQLLIFEQLSRLTTLMVLNVSLLTGDEELPYDVQEVEPSVENVEPSVEEMVPVVTDMEPDVADVDPGIEEVELTVGDVEETVGPEDSELLPFQRSFDFRLGKGLEKLATLRSLYAISFNYLTQRMSENEVSWMMEHWKELYGVCGQLNEDEDTDNRLISMLEEAGIKHER